VIIAVQTLRKCRPNQTLSAIGWLTGECDRFP